MKQFGVSLLGNYIQTFSQDCYTKFSGQRYISCTEAPVYAYNYFNDTAYFNATDNLPAGGDYGGFNTTGYIYNSSVCVSASTVDYFCSTENEEFYVADSVYNDNWNYGNDAGAGIVGLGMNSPVWTILGSPASKMFDIYLTSFNSWTFADSSYIPTTLNSVITLGGFNADYTTSDAHTTFKPLTQGGYLLPLVSFGFGLTNTTATPNTQYYVDLLNSNETIYGFAANTASLALDFRGIGLPTNQFEEFANMLNVISQGEATCLDYKGGYCLLANECSYYTDMGLWDYDFKLQFDTDSDDNYIRVPLASFAADYAQEAGLCVIFVEYLQDTEDDSQQILLGGMFFQSIYAQYTLSGFNSVAISLFVNTNALPGTYIGTADLPEGTDPFTVNSLTLNTDSTSEQNGVPTFAATITGVSDSFAYYLMDFTADHTIVWAKGCNQTGLGNYEPGSCELAPTLLSSSFDATSGNTTGLLHSAGVFTDAKFGGYIVSGTKYTSKICLASGSCKLITLYAADEVSADNWRFNSDGTYGIIGMGPTSAFWNGFADSSTLQVVYSIELGRLQGFTSVHAHALTQTSVASNITFGSANSDAYTGKTSVDVSAESDFSYALNNFAFGIVYQTDGADSSQFFVEMETDYPVIFNTNFKGLGLPANLYLQVAQLLADLSLDAIVCDNELDGICVLPEACASYTSFEDYVFLFNFTTAASSQYLRVPLAVFAQNVKGSLGVTQCNIEITYLNSMAAQSSNIILGGMFF